ncbi:MAG: acyl-CoA desaturase [Legionellales bacterium]|nr:MAG: acyl-CoA desaturase [Legionellales bacterium]
MNFYGILDLSLWGYIGVTLVITHITIAAVTLYLHRCQAHNSLTLHPIISHFFRMWLWFTTGMVTKAWTAIHRKHHAKCETEEDPHSPMVLGIKKVLLEGGELYRIAAKDQEMLRRYGRGTPDDWIERNLYTKHSALGIILMMVLDLILFGVPGMTVWAAQMCWIPIFAAGGINGIGHYFGYRNFNSPDTSTNLTPWTLIVGGEELHNNHHAYPSSAKFSVRPWEFDIGWMYISILRFFGLAKVKRQIPKSMSIVGKVNIDSQTLSALITNRQHIMTRYINKVMVPILQQAKNRAGLADRNILQECKKMLKLDFNLISAEKRQAFTKSFANIVEQQQHKSVDVIYSLQKQLHDIWDRTTASQKELIDALHDWCKKAEATGIKSLQEFTTYMKAHALA